MKTFKFNALFSALFAILKPAQFNMAAINYVPGTEEPRTFDDLPAGEYAVMIIDSKEVIYTDKKTNRESKFLTLDHKIIEGKYTNRRLFNNLFLWSDAAKQMAYGQLESICRAQSRIEAVGDTTELHNIPMIVKVSISDTRKNKATGIYEALEEGHRNSITAYKKYEGDTGQFQPAVAASAPITVATVVAPPPVAGAVAAQPAAGSPPWGG
jgi:hypothetical protein